MVCPTHVCDRCEVAWAGRDRCWWCGRRGDERPWRLWSWWRTSPTHSELETAA